MKFKYIRLGQKNKGFTLIEVLLVLSFIGILVFGAAQKFENSKQSIKVRMNEANITLIEGAARLYHLDVGSFPEKVDDLIASPSGIKGWQGPYLKDTPVNPFDPGQPYVIDSRGQVR